MKSKNAAARVGSISAVVVVTALAASGFILALLASSPATGAQGLVVPDSVCTVGVQPRFPAYDPVNHYVYIPNFTSHNVSVLSSTCTLVATITLPNGSLPTAAAFNPADNSVFVTGTGSNSVYVIGGTTLSYTITSRTFAFPFAVIYDPGSEAMIVSNSGGNNISAIYGGGSVVLAYSTGSGPYGLAYDPFWGHVLVANHNSNNVTILDAMSLGTHVADVGVGCGPEGIAYDPVFSLDYVTNYCSNNVTEIDNQFIGSSIPVGKGPEGIAWDQAHLDLYVANYGSGNVTVISAGAANVNLARAGVGAHLIGVCYDEFNNKVYATFQYMGTSFGHTVRLYT